MVSPPRTLFGVCRFLCVTAFFAVPRHWTFDQFPFRPSVCIITHLHHQLRSSLGSAHPCPSTVHTEPFSTSVFKVLHLNICYYHQDLHQRPIQSMSPSIFSSTPAPFYSPRLLPPRRQSVGRTLQRHPFSGLIHSAGES